MYRIHPSYENPDNICVAFPIRSKFQAELDRGGKISEDLLQELNKGKYLVSQRTNVSIQEEGKKWIITDMHIGNEFTVRKDKAGALYVYPGREDMKIWRYLDFTKFLFLLKEKSLFFNRADNFEDIHEGIFPRDTARFHDNCRDLIARDGLPVESVTTGKQLRLTAEIERMYTFVNSWHINKHESSAMWKLYLKNDEEGVAIKSTYKHLRDCFKDCQDDVYIGKVKYETMSVVVSTQELNNPELYKGKNFEHEREIRAVIKLSREDINSKIKGAVEKYRELHNSGELIQKILKEPNLKDELFDLAPGKIVHIEPKELIEKIVVSPTAKEWIFNLVKSIAEEQGLGERVTKSEIGSWA